MPLLALDAKVRWIIRAVWQRALGTNVRSSTSKSAYIFVQQYLASHFALIDTRQEWDAIRKLVPPGFHQTSSDSSLFGSQHSLNKADGIIDPTQTLLRPFGRTSLRRSLRPSMSTTWKTSRDFVDESAIEQVLDAVEND
ncbi:hypothetical protein L210DRAFT_2366940 [Boletus edulis BED1]|uniref:Uncharacterized protein n=1 Tax=Boletus edulis BED1 TaxID=1328754 RepID=A0AAD4G6I8_BOLED|nr:hypothetical protein L210DRAFT_2366940 [Boletus edulis BED1]